jgi:general secretion pathway protein D
MVVLSMLGAAVAAAAPSAGAAPGGAAPSDRGAKAAPPGGTPATEATSEATIALNFQDVDIPVLAKFVSEVTGRNFIVDDRVRGKVTIISPTRLTPDEAYLVFESVLQVKGFATLPSGTFTKIVPVRDATQASAAGGHEITTRVVPLEHADAAALVPVLQPLVSKDGILTAHPATNRLVVVDAAGNVERLAALARELDRPGTAEGAETLTLRNAPADELAKRLRETLVAEPGTASLRVVAEPRTNSLVFSGGPDQIARARAIARRLDVASLPGSSTVHVYRLKNADAGSLVRVLAQLVGLPLPPEPERRPQGSSFMRRSEQHDEAGYGYDGASGTAPEPPARPEPASTGTASTIPLEAPVRITADPATNALIVSATPQDWQTLSTVIGELDVRRRQVFVEAVILEVTTDKLRALGVEFRGATSTGSGVALGQLNTSALASVATDPTSLPALILAAASNQTITLPSGEQVPAYSVLLTALQQERDVNVLSSPNIVTTDNEEAEIVVGRNVPFVASRATSSSNLSNLFTTIERHDVGITLRMTPQIIADDYVRLTLFEEVSDIDVTTPEVGDPALVGPTTTVRSASTVVAARDGQTVVIGGLLSDTRRASERGVPFLSDVPVLGSLFRRTDDRQTKTNLLIFLTPHVVATDAQMAARSATERAKLPGRAKRRARGDERAEPSE